MLILLRVVSCCSWEPKSRYIPSSFAWSSTPWGLVSNGLKDATPSTLVLFPSMLQQTASFYDSSYFHQNTSLFSRKEKTQHIVVWETYCPILSCFFFFPSFVLYFKTITVFLGEVVYQEAFCSEISIRLTKQTNGLRGHLVFTFVV